MKKQWAYVEECHDEKYLMVEYMRSQDEKSENGLLVVKKYSRRIALSEVEQIIRIRSYKRNLGQSCVTGHL